MFLLHLASLILFCIFGELLTAANEPNPLLNPIRLPAENPMVSIPFALARPEIEHRLLMLDGYQHLVQRVLGKMTFYVYSRWIFARFRVNYIEPNGTLCSTFIAPSEKIYVVKYLACSGG